MHEMWVLILHNLSLMQLRLVKSVSRSMANHCRKTLRCDEWQDWGVNLYAMECDVATHATQSYSLPMTVRFFADTLVNPPCIATVHRLKLTLHANRTEENPVNVFASSNWSGCHFTQDHTSKHIVEVVDMLIEVHGRGICGSEYALRRVLSDELKERAFIRECPPGYPNPTPAALMEFEAHVVAQKEKLAQNVCSTLIRQDVEDGQPGCHEVDDNFPQMNLWEILEQANPVTQIGKSSYMMHRVPCQQIDYTRDNRHVDLMHVCAHHPCVIT